MTFRAVFTVNAIVLLAFGASFLLLPDQVLALYGVVLDDQSRRFVRMFSTAVLGLGSLALLFRGETNPASMRRAALRARLK